MKMENNNNKQTNNFDFDFSLIANFFKRLDRQGPGGREQTLQALEFVKGYLPKDAQIADLGCGTGGQTVTLAHALPDSHITAVDLLVPMIEGMQERIIKQNLQTQITLLLASMDALSFPCESFDLILAEGSIYHIGYKKGLEYWRQFIKTMGYVAISDCCWLSDKRPQDIQWFNDNFAEIDTIAAKLSIMQSAGYEPTAHFILPSECWTKNYYEPVAERIKSFTMENPDNSSAQMFIEQLKIEIEQYRLYGDYYGYVFFVGRKL